MNLGRRRARVLPVLVGLIVDDLTVAADLIIIEALDKESLLVQSTVGDYMVRKRSSTVMPLTHLPPRTQSTSKSQL